MMRLSLCLADDRRKKKKKIGERSIVKDDSRSTVICWEIPQEILIEILVRLPAYSLMRFKCVSKLWSSLISSRYFTNLFLNFSSSIKGKSRLFVYKDDHMLFSSSLSNLDATPSFSTLNRDLTLPCIKNDRLELVNSLRGLMCFRAGRDIRIINFTTRQVLNLPRVESNMFLESDEYDVWNYFGYDPINDEYKVLSTISSTDKTNGLRSESWVFVLGDGASWRNTKSLTFSPPPHDPDERGIPINCVLYYGAWSHEKRSVLMSFDFNSEEFNMIELPLEFDHIVDLIYYKDQVAVFDDSRLKTECILGFWVLDAGKNKWSHKGLILHCHQIRLNFELEDMDDLYITSSRRGKLRLCWRYVNNNKITYAFYDLENNRITGGFVIESPYSSYNFLQSSLWEDVESIMYLEA